jgi:hypothetical protein
VTRIGFPTFVNRKERIEDVYAYELACSFLVIDKSVELRISKSSPLGASLDGYA